MPLVAMLIIGSVDCIFALSRFRRVIFGSHSHGGDKAAGNEKIKRKLYEKELRKLQVQWCDLQDWAKAKGLRVIVLLQGRDLAGKGGTYSRR